MLYFKYYVIDNWNQLETKNCHCP